MGKKNTNSWNKNGTNYWLLSQQSINQSISGTKWWKEQGTTIKARRRQVRHQRGTTPSYRDHISPHPYEYHPKDCIHAMERSSTEDGERGREREEQHKVNRAQRHWALLPTDYGNDSGRGGRGKTTADDGGGASDYSIQFNQSREPG